MGFHAALGCYFRRTPAGQVEIYVSSPATRVVLEEGTWASIMASVSRLGESASTFAVARAFHAGAELAVAESRARSAERLPHADVPGLTPETCPERENHGNPFRYCPVKGCGWHDGMSS